MKAIAIKKTILLMFFTTFSLLGNSIDESINHDIIQWLDACLNNKVKNCIKSSNIIEFSRYTRFNENNTLSWDELRETDNCFNRIDTLIHTDTIYTNYFGNMLDIFDVDILEILNKEYHQHLNGVPFNFERDMDSLRKLIRKYDSTTVAWKTADTIKGFYIPVDLQDTYNQIDKLFSITIIENFKNNKSEDNAVGIEHFGMGLSLRNAWKLGHSRLNQFFAKFGVHSADNVSSIIVTAWYRYLNNKPINFDKLIEEYRKYQELTDVEEMKLRNKYKKK